MSRRRWIAHLGLLGLLACRGGEIQPQSPPFPDADHEMSRTEVSRATEEARPLEIPPTPLPAEAIAPPAAAESPSGATGAISVAPAEVGASLEEDPPAETTAPAPAEEKAWAIELEPVDAEPRHPAPLEPSPPESRPLESVPLEPGAESLDVSDSAPVGDPDPGAEAISVEKDTPEPASSGPVAASADLAPASPAFEPVAEEFLRRIEPARLLETVERLVALGPRMGGTASGEAASRFAEDRFREAGLEVSTILDPVLRTHEESWDLAAGLAGEDWTPLRDGALFAFSSSVPQTEAPLRVVDEAAFLEAPQASALAERAVLLVPEKVFFEPPGDFLDRAMALPIRGILVEAAPVLGLEDATPLWKLRPLAAGPSVPVFSISRSESRFLRGAVGEGKALRVRFRSESRVGRGSPRSVLATLPGADSERQLLLCAHGDSDSGGPGADDNASGVSVLLEVARILAEMRASGAAPPPSVTLRFAVWGTELHSSGAYVSRLATEELRRIVGVLNLDQVGAGEERDAVYLEPNDLPHHLPWIRAFHEIGEAGLRRGGLWSAYTSIPSLGGTDSYMFAPRALARKGVRAEVPSLTLFTASFGRPERVLQTPGFESPGWPEKGEVFVDYSPVYHTTGDVPSRTTAKEPRNLLAATAAAGTLVLRVLESRYWEIEGARKL